MTQITSTLLHADLTEPIIGGFYCVYNELGYGFFESNYASALAVELELRGFQVRREVPTEVTYRGVSVGTYRIDMVVEDRVLVETKATKILTEADERQVQNYLKASKLNVGLLLHFGPKPAFRRFIYT